MKIPFRLLRAFCPPHLLEEIEGDLLQQYERDLNTSDHPKRSDGYWRRRAKRRLLWNVIRYLRPGILLRNKFSSNRYSTHMMISDFRFTTRHLIKNKSNSFIHVAGLATGITVCLLIALYITHQAGFDLHHQHAESIYRVNSVFHEGEINFNLYATPGALSQSIKSSVRGVKQVARTRALFKTIVEAEPQKLFKQDHILMVEPSFADVFDVKTIKGETRKILQRPYQAMLSQSTAIKYFGEKDPLGKVIKLKNKYSFTVAGIMEDSPGNTSLPADVLLSFTDAPELLDNGDTWFFGDFEWVKLQMLTFILLEEGTDVASVQSQVTAIANKNVNANPRLSEKIHASFELQPLKEIHFDTQRFGGGPWVPAVSKSWLLFFAGIGAVVLVLACVNFLNLSTAQAATRAKEVGIRKSIGAVKSQLVFQFLTEAFLLVMTATLLSLLVVSLSLNAMNDLIGQSISLKSIVSTKGISSLLGGVVMIVVLAGLYPAWFISRFSPITSLKANLLSATFRAGGMLRRSLVAVQFIISTVLIIAVLVMSQQVEFMHTKNLGFERESILTVELPDVRKAEMMATEVSRLPEVKDVSLSRTSPISKDHWWNSISLNATSPKRFSVCAIYGNEKFYSFYGLKILSGRAPTREEYIPDSLRGKDDVYKVVVNEKLLKTLELGEPHEALGKHFWWGSAAEIVGVVADFNTEPLEYEITPTIITQHPDLFSVSS
jgi:putative ABC transport system permease protein